MASATPPTTLSEDARPRQLAAGRLPISARFFAFVLFISALLPRLVALNRYITPDELIWVYRSVVFREALLAGRWLDTIVAGHPGVTTTWLGAAAISLRLLIDPSSRAPYDLLARMAYLTPDNTAAFEWLALFLDPARIAVAVLISAGIVAVFILVRRLWGDLPAAAAAGLLALDPFAAGLSGLLHVDGLSATFGLLSLLGLLVALNGAAAGRPDRRWLALSGALAGLAILSKSPLLVLLPMSGLVLALGVLRDSTHTWPGRLGRLVTDCLVWGGAALLVIALLYPAMWQSPLAVATSLSSNANRHIDEALRPTFFLGRVNYDSGPLFYPIVLLWRLSPIVMLGLVSVPALWLRRRRAAASFAGWPTGLAHLLLWAVVFITAITPAAKKFDRYALPAIMALVVAAGVGLAVWAAAKPRRHWVVPAVLAAQALFLLAFVAYPLAAYNPLVGGPWTAARVLPVGWGEGISAAGRHLSQTQPAAATETAIADIAPSLAPFFVGQTLVDGIDDPAAATYHIETLSGRQLAGAAADTGPDESEPIMTVRFGGLDQAWVYRRTPTAVADVAPLPEPILFGEAMALVAAEPRTMADDAVQLVVRWNRARPPAIDERYQVNVVLRDAAGNEWATVATDLLSAAALHPVDWPADDSGLVHYLMETPPGMPPGDYRMEVVVVDARTGSRLPARTASDGFLGVVAGVGGLIVPPSPTPDVVTRMAIPVVDDTFLLDGALRLLGHSRLAPEALAGSDLPVDLFWHAPGELPAGLALGWQLRPSAGGEPLDLRSVPLSGYDTGDWRPAETIHEKYRVPLPPSLVPADYALGLWLSDAGGLPVSDLIEVGQLRINNIDRLYDLPTSIETQTDGVWADLIKLHGLDLRPRAAAAGDSPEMTLYWQSLGEPDTVYTAFVHLLNEDDTIIAQFDHWPGGLPSDIWAADQVIIDRFPVSLPPDLPPGDYRFAVGLYTAANGVRLPVRGSGAADPDRFILPVTLVIAAP